MEKNSKENTSTTAYYLRDLGFLLRERAFAAKNAKAAAQLSSARDYERGRLMAFNEVISLMQNQAIAFQLPLDAVGLAGIDPDHDLT